MEPRDHERDRTEREDRQSPGWDQDINLAQLNQDYHDKKISDDPRKPKQEREVNPQILAPALFGQQKHAAQEIGGQWWMIEIATVRISPFEPVFVQNFGKAVKKDGVVSADSVVGNSELERRGDKRERDDKRRAQIASGAHALGSSSFNAFNGERRLLPTVD